MVVDAWPCPGLPPQDFQQQRKPLATACLTATTSSLEFTSTRSHIETARVVLMASIVEPISEQCPQIVNRLIHVPDAITGWQLGCIEHLASLLREADPCSITLKLSILQHPTFQRIHDLVIACNAFTPSCSPRPYLRRKS